MNIFAAAFYYFCLALCREFGGTNPQTIDEVLKQHPLPIFAAQEAHIKGMRWKLWTGFWPTQAGRLMTDGYRAITTKEQLQNLKGGVLIYCSEPAPLRAYGDLVLWAGKANDDMARATPLLSRGGAFAGLAPILVPFGNPMKVTLVHLDKQGHVLRSERRDIIEMRESPASK